MPFPAFNAANHIREILYVLYLSILLAGSILLCALRHGKEQEVALGVAVDLLLECLRHSRLSRDEKDECECRVFYFCIVLNAWVFRVVDPPQDM